MIISIIEMIIGVMVVALGLYYLMKEGHDKESRIEKSYNFVYTWRKKFD